MDDERRDARAFIWKLVLADTLTSRGDIGPLERVWAPGFDRRPLRGRPRLAKGNDGQKSGQEDG